MKKFYYGSNTLWLKAHSKNMIEEQTRILLELVTISSTY